MKIQKTIGILLLLVGFIAFLPSCNSDIAFQKLMEKTAKDINKQCPIQVDSDMVWDSVNVLPNKTFQYYYTIKNFEASDIDTINVKKERTPIMLNSIKSEASIKIYRDHKTTFLYVFKDKLGKPAFSITITPDMYSKK
ncbi:MAG: hypothetical protein DI598_16250 [Pseudopedobacter saltans]|uniref:Uncharacterized protein n=1 Tax=Pseudopedobacter saltans TaxID=151895 RepID=A0A2W5EP52_9SPHI|nr:MAG: hypothetical protein DI598_16250 [Pseudopedobacter saltans]